MKISEHDHYYLNENNEKKNKDRLATILSQAIFRNIELPF